MDADYCTLVSRMVVQMTSEGQGTTLKKHRSAVTDDGLSEAYQSFRRAAICVSLQLPIWQILPDYCGVVASLWRHFHCLVLKDRSDSVRYLCLHVGLELPCFERTGAIMPKEANHATQLVTVAA